MPALQRAAYEKFPTVSVINAANVLQIVQDVVDQIALVILDLSMPVMSGEECLKKLKGIRPDIPVLLSRGFNEAEVVRRFQASGVTGFLQKPYTARHLAEVVKSTLSSVEHHSSL